MRVRVFACAGCAAWPAPHAQIPDSLMAITTVGQFVQLAEMAEKDAQLKKVVSFLMALTAL